MATHTAYVGTYTEDTDSGGVYTCRVDGETGAMERRGVTDAGPDPSFLAVAPGGDTLYAVNEVGEGSLTALSIDDDGDLGLLNRQPSGGAGPCHVSVDATGRYALVANYAGGTVAMLPIRDDDGLDEPGHVVEHEGSGADPGRQEGPHPHSITPGPDNEVAYVPDLGTDRLVTYGLDLDGGRLRPDAVPDVELPAGAGPRHLEFSPDGRYASLINELDSTLTGLERDPSTGELSIVDAADTLPGGYEGENYTADVHVHPDGATVYGSNRGHDSIAVFDGTEGRPVLRDHVSTGGEWPRNFAVGPAGDHLFVANADTDDVHVFAIDDDGDLHATDETTTVPQPVCVRFRS